MVEWAPSRCPCPPEPHEDRKTSASCCADSVQLTFAALSQERSYLRTRFRRIHQKAGRFCRLRVPISIRVQRSADAGFCGPERLARLTHQARCNLGNVSIDLRIGNHPLHQPEIMGLPPADHLSSADEAHCDTPPA